VIEAAREAGVRRFVFASSVKAMGEGDGGVTVSAYGRSKLAAEQIVLGSGIREPVVLRLALVYGPRVEGNLGAMVRAIRSYRFPPPPPFPNRRSMVHVEDVVRAMIAAVESPAAAGKTIVVTDGVEYSTRDIYNAINAALGRPSPAWSLPAPCWRLLALAGDAIGALARRRAPFDTEAYHKLFSSAWYEPGDMRAVLGMVPRFTLQDALPAMAERR
jgi:nucleoside-diphosphate-sugar epimerase